MSADTYALDNAWELARRRLAGLESTYDETTRRRLTQLGLDAGWRCLEVGAGGGSIARWMGEQVGPGGQVVAADLDVSHLRDMPDSVSVQQLNVVTDDLPEKTFDLVHTRLVLNHIAEREAVLDKLVRSLRPGGRLLLEEGDVFATGAQDEDEDHTKAMRAWFAVLARVADIHLGHKVPRMIHERGLEEIGVECEVPFAEGGTLDAEWILLTFDQLEQLAGGDILDAGTKARWRRKLATRGTWYVSLALVAVHGRRAA